jgi:hypothetical protein
MNPFEMVVCIVIIATVGSVLRARFGVSRNKDRRDYVGHDDPGAQAETQRLREELRSMKERIAVLERLATEDTSGARLDREIEKLRDRT